MPLFCSSVKKLRTRHSFRRKYINVEVITVSKAVSHGKEADNLSEDIEIWDLSKTKLG